MKLKVVKIGKFKSLTPDMFIRAINDSLRTEALEIEEDFMKTTDTWDDNHPEFEIVPSGNYQLDIYTENRIYGYLDRGTEPHTIAAKKAPTLAFPTQPAFLSKSKPNSLSVRRGKKPVTGFAFPKVVSHPGFPARNYAKLIAKKAGKRFAKELRANLAAVNRAASK